MSLKLKGWYVSLIEKEKRNILESFFYCILYLLSFIYGGVVFLKNWLYNHKIISALAVASKVISVGNISWSGTGKTPLSIFLYEKLKNKYKVAILRRGYGSDEGELLKEKIINVFSAPKRYELAKSKESEFDLFILDDGFQHRRLKRDLNIVVMGAREFRRKHALIPAYIFREPMESLKRADIIVINYAKELSDILKTKKYIKSIAPHAKLYFADYKVKGFKRLNGESVDKEYFADKKIAAMAGIGYPKGFFDQLKYEGLEVVKKLVYPDHYELTCAEFKDVEKSLLDLGINDLIITHKDKYHLPYTDTKINIFIMEVDFSVNNEDIFLKDIFEAANRSN